MTKLKEQILHKGSPLSEGIAIGTLYHLKENERYSVPEFAISSSQVSQEIGRYRRAISSSRDELERLQFYLNKEGSEEAVGIISTHIQMLEDPVITSGVEEKIEQMQLNTESVFVSFINDYARFFEESDDPELHQRILDVRDLSTRILKHLYPQTDFPTSDIPSHSIVAAYELVPSHTAEASPNQVRAYVTEMGGPTSHSALIARSKGIPYVSNIEIESILGDDNVNAIVDGNQGLVIINPSDDTLKQYHDEQNASQKHFVDFGDDLPETPKTLDGIEVEVQANLESIHDLHLLKEYKVRSIGLVRSEFLYLKKELEEFKENEQYEVYKKLLKLAGDIQVTFRVFDVGSDKAFFKSSPHEPNPALGCRSIRFLMQHPKIFSAQVRAILKAAKYGNLKILLPLISDIEELRSAKAFIQTETEKLESEGHTIPKDIPIGCMVEVPAFVIMCDEFVKECDFLSIGTNDLVQYTLVADRANPKTFDRYGPTHPSILRMIKRVVEEANKANIPVSICGDIASNSDHTQLLIDLGIRSLSCPPRFIPQIKRTIQKCVASS